MRLCRLFLVILVLLQSGLAVGHVHAHPGRAAHTKTPHLHACELLELFTPASHHEHDGEEDHDADAVDLSNVIVSAAPPAPELLGDLVSVEFGAALEAPADHPLPLGLPPSTAGPQRPLYLVLCTLTI